jgi:hypothetical protein
MRTSTLLRIILVIEIVALVGATMAVARDYQDSWILEGLEIPFLIFIGTYIAYSYIENRMPWIVTFAVIVRSVFQVIPNLKYTWFQGVEYDVNIHYRLYQVICNSGFVPSSPIYNNMLYLHTPSMHIWFGINSIVTALPQLVTFKYLPALFWLSYPLIIYMIVKAAVPESQKSLKYALLVSSIPVGANMSYLVEGQLFGALLIIMFVAWFTRLLQSSRRNLLIVLWIFSFALVSEHSYSPVILAIGFLAVYLLHNTNYVKQRTWYALSTFKFSYVVFLIVLTASWETLVAQNLFEVGANIFARWVNAIFGTPLTGRTFTDINLSLFRLTLENQLKIVVVFYGGSLFFAFLTVLGILVAVKKYSSSKPLIFISLFLLSIWSLFIFQLVLPAARAGMLEYHRIFVYSLTFAPIFIGLLLAYIDRKFGKVKLSPVILSLLVIFATIEVYGCQPLLPIASSVRSNLPSDEYFMIIGNVNSAYQRYMIAYAEKHIGKGMIACDPITGNQILGLTDYSFSQSHLADFYPFNYNTTNALVEYNTAGEKIDYILIHLPGKSGWLGVKPEVGTKDFILGVTRNSSLIYSNGESFILTNPFMYHNTP